MFYFKVLNCYSILKLLLILVNLDLRFAQGKRTHPIAKIKLDEFGTKPEISARVNDGDISPIRYPFMVALLHRDLEDPEGFVFFCGGSLIDDRHVLTAGHCVPTVRLHIAMKNLVQAWIGGQDLGRNFTGIRKDIISVDIGEQFLLDQLIWNDIGVLTLNDPVPAEAAKPICIGIGDYVNQTVTVAGYGVFDCFKTSRKLRVAVGKTRDIDNCGPNAPKSTLTDAHICSIFQNSESMEANTNSGDSGSALFFQDEKNVYVQVGIVSFGFLIDERQYPNGTFVNGCPKPEQPSAYSRVGAFIPFIKAHAPKAQFCKDAPRSNEKQYLIIPRLQH